MLRIVYQAGGFHFMWAPLENVTVKIGPNDMSGWSHQMDPPIEKGATAGFTATLAVFQRNCDEWVRDYEEER